VSQRCPIVTKCVTSVKYPNCHILLFYAVLNFLCRSVTFSHSATQVVCVTHFVEKKILQNLWIRTRIFSDDSVVLPEPDWRVVVERLVENPHHGGKVAREKNVVDRVERTDFY
jgi:hypothetical protein